MEESETDTHTDNGGQRPDAQQSALFGGTHLLPSEVHLHQIFEGAISSFGERAAVTGLFFLDEFWSYNEVNRRANRAARGLLERLSNRYKNDDDLPLNDLTIAVDIEPCADLLVALLAVLKLGAAYVPVDSRSAINRVRYVLNEARPLCVLIDENSAFQKDTNTVWSQFFIVDFSSLLDADPTTDNDCHDNLCDSEVLKRQGQLLSVIYTSGSTGKPKGVCLSHRTAYNRLEWQWTELPFEPEEVACFKTSLLFVDSIVEIFSSMLKLISLVISPKNVTTNPDAFVSLLESYDVTRLVMVPSMLRSLLFYLSISGGGDRLPELKLWMSNSETLPVNLLEKFFDLFPVGKLFANIYGSTETMADVTYELYRDNTDISLKSFDGNLSIGRPMFNNWLYITDEKLNLLPKGQLGEICITGINVANGYLDSDVTSSNFIENPFSYGTEYKVLYKTGDFGRITNDMVIYEGRRDLQVKIRGQRVNIREIERVIQDCPEVDRTIVLCHQFSDVSTVIVAYYTTHQRRRQTRVESRLMDACRKSLPPYMRPKFLHVEEIPLQPYTGKVDRLALRRLYELAFNRQSSRELAVLDEKGQKALNIIAMNLNFLPKALPMGCSFFECGGNSISMMCTIVTLKEHGLHIPIDVFSSARTIQDIIDHVELSVGPIGETLRTDKYEVKRLHRVERPEHIIDVLTDSFIEKEPLDTLLGVTRHEFLTFARSLYHQATQSDLSLVVFDRASGDIVGGDFLFDYFRGVQVEHHESMEPILRLFREFEEPVKRRLVASNPGRLMFNFCLCVHKDLPHADQVRICHLIEGHVLRTAKETGFVGVVTNNTNPVTQVGGITSYGQGTIGGGRILTRSRRGSMPVWWQNHRTKPLNHTNIIT